MDRADVTGALAAGRFMRTNHVLFECASLRIREVRCRAGAHEPERIEYSSTHTLVLPESGVFVKHEGRSSSAVADPAHGIFFTAGRPYRVSHPAPGGDDCLVLEYDRRALLDLMQSMHPSCAGPPDSPFRVLAVRLGPGDILRRRLLRHRLARRISDPLEIEESAFALFDAAVAAAATRSTAGIPGRREVAAQSDLVRATVVAIAEHPEERWSLESIARRVHASRFHLARLFRRHVGSSIHRYLQLARLTRALDRVLDSKESLASIGLDAGFAHHSHFTAAFHRTFRVTPSALRRMATPAKAAELRTFLTAACTPRR